MGIIVYVVKNSGGQEMRTLMQNFGAEVDGPFAPTDKRPAVLIALGPLGAPAVYDAAPCSIDEGARVVPEHVGPMMDGRWIYTSDARFPSTHPLPYFDRWETPEMHGALSC